MPFEKMDQSSGSVLGFRVVGTIKKADYEDFVPQVASVIESEGSVCLLCDMDQFKWEAVSAWGSDMRFGREYHDKITKMAIVGDSRWQSWLTKVAEPFYAGDAKYFTTDNEDAAWDWLRE